MADIAATIYPLGPYQFAGLFSTIPFSASCTLTALAAAETSQLVTGVAGAKQGDIVILGIVEDAEGGTLTATVSADNVVELIFSNATGSTITIPVGTVVKGVVLQLNDSNLP